MEELAQRLDRIERLLIIGTKEALTTAEAALMLNVSESRIRHLASEKRIPYYKQGGRTYYKKSELVEWQLSDRIPTNEELRCKGTTYAVINR